MCGFAGFLDFTHRGNNNDILYAMIATIRHRGPDDSGIFFQHNEHCSIGLGHARLSIIDLSSKGHQPMSYKHLSIVYNGEIYNYREIKKELKEIGHTFISTSDTEVILHAYEQWGRECVSHFIGMFAFAIFDAQSKELILCRDRAGVKPLYYYWQNGVFIFGSELKSFSCHPMFCKDINYDALALYFRYGIIPSPHCIFKATAKLSPGSLLIFNIPLQQFILECYWDVLDYYRKPKLVITYADAKEEVKNLLRSCCEYRMVSDVPVGVFLSGGYDSTSVAALLQHDRKERIKTFTIGFEEDAFNEAPFAKEIAKHLGTDHTEYYCRSEEAKQIIPKLPYYYDEPFADSSAIPTSLVSKVARQKVKVALSADAGDEIFAGYGTYVAALKNLRRVERIPSLFQKGVNMFGACLSMHSHFGRKVRVASKVMSLTNKARPAAILQEIAAHMEQENVRRLFKVTYKDVKTTFDNDEWFHDDLSTIQAIHYQSYLVDDILTKVDRATMSVSLEGREPLLDHRLIEYVAQLPTEFKFAGCSPKRILKDIVHDHVPYSIMNRPKKGFGVPIYDWLRDDLHHLLDKYLDRQRLIKQEIFNPAIVKSLVAAFEERKIGQDVFVWEMLMFQMWYDKWMN